MRVKEWCMGRHKVFNLPYLSAGVFVGVCESKMSTYHPWMPVSGFDLDDLCCHASQRFRNHSLGVEQTLKSIEARPKREGVIRG